jgi:hypothetical protein
MTDRYNYLTVALEQDIRSDDAEDLIKAITMLRGVLKVEPNVVNDGDWTAETRVRQELGAKLFEIVYPKKL